jgi:hypothetical protein
VDFIGVEPGLMRIFVACFFVWGKLWVCWGNWAFGEGFFWFGFGELGGNRGLLMYVF